MKKSLVTFFIILILGGCAIKPTVLDFTAFHKAPFSARDAKANISTQNAMRLIADGNVLIGYIDLRQNLRSCYPDNGCKQIHHSNSDSDESYDFIGTEVKYPREEELGYEIARLGGDKYSLLEEINTTEVISKNVCTNWGVSTNWVNGVLQVIPICNGYSKVYGTLSVKIKRALVWRHEPDLAASDDNIRALKSALDTISGNAAKQADDV